ncbi:MAG: type I DNA topoisomerase [Candidatus Hydrogenedentes bacterium]|nr:type I DNA topoisomerase [Candidatus Hydrogenedentota bacterium]
MLKLVIVESPAKAKTIGKFLGKGYEVVASYGHVRDLPSSAEEIPESIKGKPWARMAVDVENDFTPVYVVQADSKKHIAELKKLVKASEEVVLATDEDREGEAISWHLLEILQPKVPVKRIAFHEITKTAIEEAIASPREVNYSLVRAQESRRILDRLYGYSLSPVLWKKVRTKLSAGRVQSVAVRLVVEREEERRAFHTATFWDIEAQLEADGIGFKAVLSQWDGKRIAGSKDFDEKTGKLIADKVHWLKEAEAKSLASGLETAAPWQVIGVEQKASKRKPPAPFITSSLQQAASSLLGMSPKQTMQVAQRLYEGVDLGGGEREGLITYMRTDSVILSERALAEAAQAIKSMYGDRYHERRQYSTKSKMAQEAHEAIRPTHLSRPPREVAAYVSKDELRLYALIWNRTMASQMADAELMQTSLEIGAKVQGKEAVLRATGTVVTFDGFLKVSDAEQSDVQLPHLNQGQKVGRNEAVKLHGLEALGHETKPPARFNEASLVRRLEEEGIGRPSTYAPTISIIQQRGYVDKRGKALVPTYLGIAVTLLLRKHFSEFVDVKFTARMENALDDIAEEHQDWKQFLSSFYFGNGDFGHGLQPQIDSQMEQIDFPSIPVGDDEAGLSIVVRLGRTQAFLQRGEGGTGHTATVPEDIAYDELTVEKAVSLLEARAKGNEPLGQDPETGLNVYAILGPFGPYVQLGEVTEGEKKPKRVSLGRGFPLEDVTLDIAMQYLGLPRKVGDHPETGKSIRTAIGRFGPYVVCDGEFRSLPTTETVFSMTLDEAVALLAQPKRAGRQKVLLHTVGEHPESKAALEIYEGRYGPYITLDGVNASLPKGVDPATVTVAQALELLAAAAERKPAAKKRAVKKKAAAKAPAKKAPAKKAVAKKAAAKKPAAKKAAVKLAADKKAPAK